jgi:hypothetical protein
MSVEPAVNGLLDWVWRASWQASVLVGLIRLVQALARRRLTAGRRSGLWWLVLIRLVMPAGPQTSWSLFNYARLETELWSSCLRDAGRQWVCADSPP